MARTQKPMQRPPDGSVREMLLSILIPYLPNAPFSATVTTKSIRQLRNDGEITLVNRRKLARDKDRRPVDKRRKVQAMSGEFCPI